MLRIQSILLILFSIIFSQVNQDARMLGLNGTYTTLANGFRAVGINPANLAVYKSKSWNIADFNFGLSNNFFSIENYNTLSGSHLEDSTHVNYYPKEKIIDEFKGRGLRVMQSLNIPITPLNFCSGSFAFTSRISSNIDIGLSNGMIQLLFSGNPLQKNIDLDIEETIISTQEVGLSYGHSFEGFSSGFTLKYLSGLFYMGMEPLSSKTLTTDTYGFHGNPQYIIRQAVGGKGLGLDLGIITDESEEGLRFGISLINLLGTIKWSQNYPNQIHMDPVGIWGTHLLGNSLEKIYNSDYYLRPNELIVVNFVLDSITATSLTADSLMYYETYKVVPINNVSNIDISPQDSGLIIILNDGTYLYPSGNTYNFVDLLSDGDTTYTLLDHYSEYSTADQIPLKTRQPIYLRIGISKQWEGQAVVAMDFITGFSNRFSSSTTWRFSLGTEITRFKNKFLRMGYAFGGVAKKSLSFGYGAKIGRLYFDFGFSLIGGFTFSEAKGFNLATGIIWNLD